MRNTKAAAAIEIRRNGTTYGAPQWRWIVAQIDMALASLVYPAREE